MFKSAIFTVGLFVASAVAQIRVETPSNVVVCRPVQITWTGGVPPYDLSLILQGTTSPAVESFTVTSSPFIYSSHLAVGTNVFVNLADSQGLVGQTAPFPILTGSDTSCIGLAYSSTSGAPASTGATATASGTSTTVAGTTAGTSTAAGTTTPGASTSGTATSATKTTGSGTTAPSASGSNSASRANIGVAGVIGAAVMAVLV